MGEDHGVPNLIERYRNEIAGICQRSPVRRLELFGSAAPAADF